MYTMSSVNNRHLVVCHCWITKAPWDTACADFVSPMPTKDHLLVAHEEYSRFPEIEKISSTSSKATIPVFDKIFSTHGIPNVLKTDNGPPFNSDEFHQFTQHLAKHHRKITPRSPRANGDAERFIKTLEKALRAAEVEWKPWNQEIYKFLRSYRVNRHITCGLLFNRTYHTNLP